MKPITAGVSLPQPWQRASTPTSAPQPERIPVCAPSIPDPLARLRAHFDGACKACGFVNGHGPKCATLAKPAQPAADALPERGVDVIPPGWHPVELPRGYYSSGYEHAVTGALVAQLDDGRWAAFKHKLDMSYANVATLIEAMAAALGLEVEQSFTGRAWIWRRGGLSSASHDVESWEFDTAEAAALAALDFDAEQRKQASAPKSAAPFAIGDLVRATVNSIFLTQGAVYTVRSVRGTHLGLRASSGEEFGYDGPSAFERVRPDEVPPSWTSAGIEFRHASGAVVVSSIDKWAPFLVGCVGVMRSEMVASMHEAMRLALGLERTEQLWLVPP